jgi:hypothetical protein
VSTADDLRDLRAGLIEVLAGQRVAANHALEAVSDTLAL